MTDVTYTKGPWVIEGDSIYGQNNGFTVLVADLSLNDDDFGVDRSEENKRMLSASVDLYDALSDMVERISYYASLAEDEVPNIEDWAYTYNSGDMQKARAALEKARKAP